MTKRSNTMKAGILHLSDIHVSIERDLLDLTSVANASSAWLSSLNHFFILISGDRGNTGKNAEYESAEKVLKNLEKRIRDIKSDLLVDFILVPGNHDCNFSSPNEMREALIHGLKSKGFDKLESDGRIIETIAEIQNNFFKFGAQFDGASPLKGLGRLYYQRSFKFDSHSISFHCYNTAWLSAKREELGTLFVPIKQLTTSIPEETANHLRIATYHHPDNWLKPESRKEFRRYIHSSSHLVLTGHEHQSKYSSLGP